MPRTGRPPKAEKITVACVQCGKEWQKYPSYGDKSKYCSRACWHAAVVGIPVRVREKRGTEQRLCERCGKEFLVGGPDHPVRTTRFCSRTCAKTSFWEAHKAAGTDINRPDMKGVPKPGKWMEPETRQCDWCKAPFVMGGSGRHQTIRFCSRSCARKSMWSDRRDAGTTSLVHAKAKEMTNEEAAWFAGVFEGEGCVSFEKRNANWRQSVNIAIANTNYPLLERVCLVTGTGRIGNKARQDKPHHAPCWTWACSGDNAREVLRQVFQHLIVKRNSAEVALGISEADSPPPSPRTVLKALKVPVADSSPAEGEAAP